MRRPVVFAGARDEFEELEHAEAAQDATNPGGFPAGQMGLEGAVAHALDLVLALLCACRNWRSTFWNNANCPSPPAVLFITVVDIISTLAAAQMTGRLKQELKRYLKPAVLAVAELGYLPIDKTGADLLFQVISQRYEQGSIVLTTNQPYNHWPKVFNNDSTLTSAVLDRFLHHAETVVLEGKSYRMKDQIESP